MKWLRTSFRRLAGVLQKRRRDAELAAELESHLQLHIEDNLRSGMTPEAARRDALFKLGGVEQTKENYRDQRGLPLLETTFQDLRFALRALRKSPGFTTVAVLTLALGIGACTSIFSVVNAVLLRQLPYKDAQRLILLWGTGGRTSNRDQISFTDLQDWRRNSRSFVEMANFHGFVYTLTSEKEPQRIRAMQVSDSYFQVIQSSPQLGRFFVPDDIGPGKQQVAVLSYDFWQQKFGGDPAVLGKTITLNLRPFVIIGVARKDLPSLPNSVIFRPPSQIYTPVEEPYSDENRSDRFLRGIGLLKTGVSLSQAQAELDVIVARLQKRYPNQDAGRGVHLVTIKDDLVRSVRSTLIVLQLAVLMVVLIACANVANLLLARSALRQREIAIRTALGASRARLARQVLTESVSLALLGGCLGVLLAYWGVEFLRHLGTNVLPELNGVSIDLPVLIFTAATSLLTGVVFGSAPALQFSGMSFPAALKSGARSLGSSLSQIRMRSVLIVVEVGLSVVLLVCAGLLMKSFILLEHVDPGFDANHVGFTFIYPPKLQDAKIEQQQAYFKNLLTRISALHDVENVGISSGVPDSGDFDSVRMQIPGRSFLPGQVPMVDRFVVSPGYFATLRIPLLSGRLFTDADDLSHPRVVVINQLLASRLFPGRYPIGQRVRIPTPGDFTEATEPDWTIVGVVGEVVQNGLASRKTMQFYAPYSQYDCATSNLLFRTHGDALQLASAVRAELRKMDSALITPEFAAMDRIVADSIVEQRFSTVLLMIFGTGGLVLAAIGIYGVISYLVAHRTSEFGIRIALGATPLKILVLVVSQGLRPVLLGGLAGVAASIPATRIIEHLLFKTERLDPLTFAAAAVVLAGAAFLACYVPARRASRVDPITALRYE